MVVVLVVVVVVVVVLVLVYFGFEDDGGGVGVGSGGCGCCNMHEPIGAQSTLAIRSGMVLQELVGEGFVNPNGSNMNSKRHTTQQHTDSKNGKKAELAH